MLIAIMSDTFDKVNDDKENYARRTKLDIMNDYIALIEPEEPDEIEATNENSNSEPAKLGASEKDSSLAQTHSTKESMMVTASKPG